MYSTFGYFFWICAFLPLLGSWEGKTQKRQVAGENKKQMAPTLPSLTLHQNHLHPPPLSSPAYPAPPPWSPWCCGCERWPQYAPFLALKKMKSRAGKFLKKLFPKDGPPSSMVLLVFWKVKKKKKKKKKNFLIGKPASMATIFIWAWRASSGEHGGVGFILGGWV